MFTGRFYIHDVEDVNFDIRWIKEVPTGARTKFQRSLNSVMRSIWLTRLNKRYDCLIKPESDTSYEEWFIKKGIKLKDKIEGNLFVELILDNEEYQFIKGNFNIRINDSTISLIDLRFIPPTDRSLDLIALMSKLEITSNPEYIIKMENEGKIEERIMFAEKQKKEMKISNYSSLLGLLFVWHKILLKTR